MPEKKKPMEYGMMGDDGLTMEERLEKYHVCMMYSISWINLWC